MATLENFSKIKKKINITPLQTLPNEELVTLQNSFYEPAITLILKPNRDIKVKLRTDVFYKH